MEFPSKLIKQAVNEISKLPGIGNKTALRLALHLLKNDETYSERLAETILKLRKEIKSCKICHNIADEDICGVCSSHSRDKKILCVVQDTRDVMAIENTAQYSGLYHVLGGIISPIEGIGPEELNIQSLISRVTAQDTAVKEVVMALSPTMEGDTTAFYLARKLGKFDVNITSVAKGIPIGSELEYTDEITLGRSLVTRTVFNMKQY